MTLLSETSFLVTPNGYKASKLYAAIPTNGNGDMTVTRATTATRVDENDLVSSVASNIPRIDYTGGGCPSILLEPQRTNLFTYSEQFDNVAWSKTASTVEANSTTSPSGVINADTHIPNTTNNYHHISQVRAVTSGVSYSFSIYAKAAGYNFLLINTISGSSSGNVGPLFDLSNGTLIGSLGGNNYNAKITSVGNSWYRIDFSYITNAVTTRIDINLFPTSTIATYSGNGTSGIYLWGAQLEAGAYATSYIPTVASTVTRNADVITKTGISDLINSEEGVLFFEGSALIEEGAFSRLISISSGSNNDRFYFYYSADGKFGFASFVGGVLQANITYDGIIANNSKVACKYKENDYALWVDGVEVGTDISASVWSSGTLDTLNFADANGGSYFFYGKVKQLQVYKTALTDTQLAALTT